MSLHEDTSRNMKPHLTQTHTNTIHPTPWQCFLGGFNPSENLLLITCHFTSATLTFQTLHSATYIYLTVAQSQLHVTTQHIVVCVNIHSLQKGSAQVMLYLHVADSSHRLCTCPVLYRPLNHLRTCMERSPSVTCFGT